MYVVREVLYCLSHRSVQHTPESLHSFYCPVDDRRLSGPRHCSKGVLKDVNDSGFLMAMTDIPETCTKHRYLKIDTGFWHI